MAPLCDGTGRLVTGHGGGQAVLGGHGPALRRLVRPEKSSPHEDHVAAVGGSAENDLLLPAGGYALLPARCQSGGQQLVLASAKCPAQAEVDILAGLLQDYRWQLLVGGEPHLRTMWLARGVSFEPRINSRTYWSYSQALGQTSWGCSGVP